MFKQILLIIFSCALLNPSLSAGGDGCIRIASVSPVVDFVTIINYTSVTVDISDYRLCSSFSYSAISALPVIVGDATSIPPDEAIVVQWTIDDNASDVALYLPTGNFSDPNAMVDFMQYGSAGNGRESEADQAGYWTAGTFVETSFSMVFIGQCFEWGVDLWFTVTSVDDLSAEDLEIGPNPFTDEFNLSLSAPIASRGVLRVMDITGKLIYRENYGRDGLTRYVIPTESWNSGVYFLQLEYEGELLDTRKLIKR